MTSVGTPRGADTAFSAPPALPPAFDGPEGEAAYLAAYDAKMRDWPVPYESLDLTSRFGQTRVVVSGPVAAPPLVLLHGYGGSLTMWWPNVAELGREHRVYAVDVMGQPGRSIPDRWISSRADLVEWLAGVLDALRIERTDLIGMSYGGWVALSFAIGAPERVRKLVLLSPAAGFVPFADEFLQRGMQLRATPTREVAAEFMRWVGREDVPRDPRDRAAYERLVDQFHLGMRHFRPDYLDRALPPSVLSDEELRTLTVPTLLLIGASEPIYDPARALERARALVPNLEGALVPRSSHMMCMSQALVVDAWVNAFLHGDGTLDSRAQANAHLAAAGAA